jgi:hypothetical protein
MELLRERATGSSVKRAQILSLGAVLAAVPLLLSMLLTSPAAHGQQKAAAYKAPRNPVDGKADLSGIWQARNTAYGSLEGHGASRGIRAGNSVVVDPADGKIPYKPEALKKRDENFAGRHKLDPLNKCFTPGVPRVMYVPYPFQIFQTPTQVQILSEFAHTTRNVYVDSKKGHIAEGEVEFWIGDSRAKWEGDTLVIDSANFHPDTWFDMSGNYHSFKLRVVERLTRTAPNVLTYEATMTDPDVFTRPWTIRMPLYLIEEPNAQLFEYECNAYLEEPGAK